jgi:hypothetical protein
LFGLKGSLPAYVAGQGDAVCSEFSEELQTVSSRWAFAGWTLAVLGTVLTAIGGVLGAGADADPWYRRCAGIVLAGLGSAAAAGSAYAVSRSRSASSAAARATLARTLPHDYDRFVACVRSRGLWLESRVESLDSSPPKTNDQRGGEREDHPEVSPGDPRP